MEKKKEIAFGIGLFLVPVLISVLMGQFYYPYKARTAQMPDYAKVSNDQTKYFNAKLDQLLEEVKKVSRRNQIMLRKRSVI